MALLLETQKLHSVAHKLWAIIDRLNHQGVIIGVVRDNK